MLAAGQFFGATRVRLETTQFVVTAVMHSRARALVETDESLAILADCHGFSDQSHLTRVLAQATSWTPGKLRCACEHLR